MSCPLQAKQLGFPLLHPLSFAGDKLVDLVVSSEQTGPIHLFWIICDVSQIVFQFFIPSLEQMGDLSSDVNSSEVQMVYISSLFCHSK